MERLVEDVATNGWTAHTRQQFVREYDREIGETILHLLVEYGLLADRRALRSLKSYVESRLRGQRAAEAEHPLWEIIEEVYMSIYREVFKKKLIENYVTRWRAGRVQGDFRSYLCGAVRRRFLDAISGGAKSEKELFDAIVDSAKLHTRRQYIAEAKGRYGGKVRSYLLCSSTRREETDREIQRRLRSVIDFFFERFILEKYPALRTQLKTGESVLSRLLADFEADLTAANALPEEILRYVGEVTPTPTRHERFVTVADSRDDSASEDEEKMLEEAGAQARTPDWAQSVRLRWWDRMLRCQGADGTELEELERLTLALEGEAQRDTRLCLACARLKAESPPEQRDDLRMFLVYYLSNYGTRPEASEPKETLTKENLSLETIRGRALSWEQIFQLFGRECNPTRIKNRIHEQFEAVQGGHHDRG